MLPVAAFSSTPSVESETPEQIVDNLQASLLQAMREGDELGYQGRFDFLADVIDQSHDLDYIVRAALGTTYWNNLNEDQKNLITHTFRQLSIATYAGRFHSHGGEKFEIIEQRSLPRDQILVRSKLIKSDGSTVNFDYVFKQKEARWRIVNILVGGVSDLALKRVEYRAILQRDGFLALIEMLKKKIILAEQNQ